MWLYNEHIPRKRKKSLGGFGIEFQSRKKRVFLFSLFFYFPIFVFVFFLSNDNNDKILKIFWQNLKCNPFAKSQLSLLILDFWKQLENKKNFKNKKRINVSRKPVVRDFFRPSIAPQTKEKMCFDCKRLGSSFLCLFSFLIGYAITFEEWNLARAQLRGRIYFLRPVGSEKEMIK